MISKADFYQRAIAAPVSSAENSVFRLSVWQYAPDSHKSIQSGGCYHVEKNREIVFASKEEAEEAILPSKPHNQRVGQDDRLDNRTDSGSGCMGNSPTDSKRCRICDNSPHNVSDNLLVNNPLKI